MRLREFLDDRGRSPFAEWFDRLPAASAVRIAAGLARMEAGNLSNAKSVGDGVLEYRMDFGPGFRIYFASAGNDLILCSPAGPSDDSRLTSARPSRGGSTTSPGRNNDVMALTRDFRLTVKARAERDAEFRAGLLTEAVNLLLAGETTPGKSLLRTYVNATVGFEALAKEVGISSKSLMRMLSDKGNPRAEHLFAVIRALQQQTGISLQTMAA